MHHDLCDADIAKTEAITINKAKGSREEKYTVTFHDQNKYIQQVSTALFMVTTWWQWVAFQFCPTVWYRYRLVRKL